MLALNEVELRQTRFYQEVSDLETWLANHR